LQFNVRRMLKCLNASVFLLASCFCTHLLAQSASVRGQVLDSAQAAIAGAEVTLLNTDTQVTLKTVSDASGVFNLPPQSSGRYQVTVTAPGYSTWVQSDIVLEVGEKYDLNAVLKVGTVKETVAVTALAPEIKTEDSDLSTVTEPSLVANIPLDVRNPLQEVNFTVGVTQSNSLTAGTNASTQSTTNTFYISGAKGGESDILIDGATDTINYDTHAAGDIPGLDAVREFRIYTEAYSAEFGHTAGGIESFTIKSGTNDLHGGAWEYYRSDVLDANGYNANTAGQAKPSFSRNQFGGQLGGPVFIPKLYHGRNKTFFFFSYEELRDSTPGAGFTTTVPTALEKTGNFSQTFNTNGLQNVIYDPSSLSNGVRTPFPGNMIPSSRLNPVGMALLALYPGPNKTGVGGSDENNFFSDAPNTDNDYSYDIRVDHKFSDKQSIYGHVDEFNNHILYGQVFGQPSLTPQNSNDYIPGRNIMLDHTWVISPSVIFDQHGSWAHMESHRGSVDPLGTAAFGLPASATPGLTSTFTPQVEATTNQLGLLGNSEPYERNPNSVYQYAASVTWVKGIHVVKFGTDLRLYRDQLYDPQLLTVNTSRTFTGGPTANAPGGTTGNAIAELLLGQATVTSGYAPQVNFGHQYYAGYAEDSAKVTHKLTVTYGLRYSYEGADTARGNELSYLDTVSPSPIASQVPSIPNLIGGVGIVGQNGVGRELQTPGKLHFEPRLGLAYSLNSKTVMHAGGGIFWHPTATYQTNPAAFGFTRKSTSIDAGTDGVTPLYNLGNPFPSGLAAPYGNNPTALPGNNTGSGPLSVELGQSISGNPQKQADAYQTVWSFDIQRSLPAGFVVTAAYVGSVGNHLYGAVQLNQLSTADLALGKGLNTVVPNPFYGVITDPSSILSKSTIQEGYLLRAYPQFTNFELLNSGWGRSIYQAGQFTLEHRLGRGLSFLLGYTYSKNMDNVGESGTSASIQNNGCLKCEWSIADLDQTNVVRLSALYQLPFGPHQQFLSHGVLGHILGGWELGSTFQYNTGQPLALTSPVQSASLGSGSPMRPTLVPGQSITQTVVNPTTGEVSSFNPKAFTETGTYAFGNAPRYLSDVRNPALTDLDASLQRKIVIKENMFFTLRFESLNALNHVVFGPPDVGVTDTNFGYNPHVQANNPRIAQVSARFTF
jgi:Carboxypeptidase regulatory-like domain